LIADLTAGKITPEEFDEVVNKEENDKKREKKIRDMKV